MHILTKNSEAKMKLQTWRFVDEPNNLMLNLPLKEVFRAISGNRTLTAASGSGRASVTVL
jgi:hypothetical protein